MMMVSRRGSPLDEHETEILYSGEPIEISEIPKTLNFDKDSRNYFYMVYKIRLGDERLIVSSEEYSYDPDHNCLYQNFLSSRNHMSIPFDTTLKEGLLDFLEKLQV